MVLVHPRNPLNIGAAARAMSNFGVHRLRLVNPYSVAFRDAKSAVGAAQLLRDAEEFETVADAIADCALVVGTTAVHNRVLQHPLRRLDPRSSSAIRKQLASQFFVALTGDEDNWNPVSAPRQFPLEVRARHPWHGYIEDHALRLVDAVGCQKVFRG